MKLLTILVSAFFVLLSIQSFNAQIDDLDPEFEQDSEIVSK